MTTPSSVRAEESLDSVYATCQELDQFYSQCNCEGHTPSFMDKVLEAEATASLLQNQLSSGLSEEAQKKAAAAFQEVFAAFSFLRVLDGLDQRVCAATRNIAALYLQNPGCRDAAWRLTQDILDTSADSMDKKDVMPLIDLLPRYTRDSLMQRLKPERTW